MSKDILIVDDSRTENAIISSILVKNGYDVSSAFNGKEALIKIEERRFDLILLDIMMPEMDGYTLLREFHLRGIDIPVIILTQKKEEYMKDLFALEKYRDFIEKPFEEKVLLSKIRDIIG